MTAVASACFIAFLDPIVRSILRSKPHFPVGPLTVIMDCETIYFKVAPGAVDRRIAAGIIAVTVKCISVPATSASASDVGVRVLG